MQLHEAAEEFIAYCAGERQFSGCTLQAYSSDLADFSRWLASSVAFADISTETLKSYLNALVLERKLAPATIRRRMACLRAFFRRMSEAGHTADPFMGWRLKLPRRKRLPRALSRSEITRLLSALAGDRAASDRETTLRTAVRLMTVTGIRVGELCKLRVADIAPDAGSLRVHGKGSRDRIVYVGDMLLRDDLRKLTENRQRAVGIAAPFLVNVHGGALTPQSVRRKLHRVARAANLARRITPHMLRHTAATLLIETGVDIRIVQRLLGHSTIATTEIYTHVSDESLRLSLERANVLGGLSALSI